MPTLSTAREWGLWTGQKKLETKAELMTAKVLVNVEEKAGGGKKGWEWHGGFKLEAKPRPNNTYYPPSCSGYAITYHKASETIYVYGGIPCVGSIQNGIRPHFYKFVESKWSEVKPESSYLPAARYGHTLTAHNKELILLGGVSEYKEKLKDRCFYSDCAAYSTQKNTWRILESSGQLVKTRKDHTTVTYRNHLIVFGGLDEGGEAIATISWINLETKKPRWKEFTLEGRFNHSMVVNEVDNGKHFLSIFGGRDSRSEIVNTLFFVPLTIWEGELAIREYTTIAHGMMPRELCVMTEMKAGFVVLGGSVGGGEAVGDSWYYNAERQTLQELRVWAEEEDLRGSRYCRLRDESIYMLTPHSHSHKAVTLVPLSA